MCYQNIQEHIFIMVLIAIYHYLDTKVYGLFIVFYLKHSYNLNIIFNSKISINLSNKINLKFQYQKSFEIHAVVYNMHLKVSNKIVSYKSGFIYNPDISVMNLCLQFT
jgi:hypothetical protein